MMKTNNYLEKANFKALLEVDDVDRIQDRLNIVDTFLDIEEHITLEELIIHLKNKNYDYDPEFVRHSMNRMVDLGFAQRKQFKGQPIRYEHRHLGRHHDHMICTKCKKITEFSDEEMEKLQLQIASAHGFHMLQHRMEIYGLCSECLANRDPLMSLVMAKAGESVVIREVAGGPNARSRLASMGIRVGDHIEIVNNNGMGRLILAHDCSRIAIGRGIARKIMVSLSHKEDEQICEEPSIN